MRLLRSLKYSIRDLKMKKVFVSLLLEVTMELSLKIELRSFCEKNDIFHNFSSLRTPLQNGVVERKNRTLQEMARTMLYEKSLPKHFWA